MQCFPVEFQNCAPPCEKVEDKISRGLLDASFSNYCISLLDISVFFLLNRIVNMILFKGRVIQKIGLNKILYEEGRHTKK
jgi:hypothetical protein